MKWVRRGFASCWNGCRKKRVGAVTPGIADVVGRSLRSEERKENRGFSLGEGMGEERDVRRA